METLRSQLTTTLDSLIVSEKPCFQTVEKLTRKAANMWLAFGTQRCRVLLVFEGSNLKSVDEKIRMAKEGVSELVVEPKLTHFGNSRGQELHTAEVIGGREGQIVKLTWSSQSEC
ncbi:MAG: hypothetical protein CL912_18820 [Deltaproteobacteria bacterium]|nr:hypothetical protein [Deltaproteobacteria bacterium]